MSEKMRIATLSFALALLTGHAQAQTEGCMTLPANFVMCTEGTAWANAEVIAFENGIAMELGTYWLEMFAAPDSMQPGESAQDMLQAVEDMIAEQARNEGLGVPETLSQSMFETEHASFVTLTTRLELPEDEPMIYMTMVADAGSSALILTFDADLATSMDGLPETLREVAEMIRPASED